MYLYSFTMDFAESSEQHFGYKYGGSCLHQVVVSAETILEGTVNLAVFVCAAKRLTQCIIGHAVYCEKQIKNILADVRAKSLTAHNWQK